MRRLAFEVQGLPSEAIMVHHRETLVEFDTVKLRKAVAIADGARKGEIPYLGEIEDNTKTGTRRLAIKPEGKYSCLTFTGVRIYGNGRSPQPLCNSRVAAYSADSGDGGPCRE